MEELLYGMVYPDFENAEFLLRVATRPGYGKRWNPYIFRGKTAEEAIKKGEKYLEKGIKAFIFPRYGWFPGCRTWDLKKPKE